MTAHQTDYEAITGVPFGRNAFYLAPRAAGTGTAKPPGKRGPKPKAFNVHIATAGESRRTNAIGRQL